MRTAIVRTWDSVELAESALPDATDEPERVRLVPGAAVPGTRYRITGWLGDGGMGVVYEAEHMDLERHVALKVLHPQHCADPGQRRTFLEEAKATSRIGSPHIVEVFDYAELPDGRLLYVMELLHGSTIDVVIPDGPMPPERVIPILRQACKGLHDAHEANVIHRDVKPENIYVRNDTDRPDRIKLLDFGIAAMAGLGRSLTGSPHYMAPEQVIGKGFGRQIDVYSLGCTAYEMLTGRTPFEGESVKEILKNHLKTEVTPPHELPGSACPEPLSRVIVRCMQKRRKQRYANMLELEAALCEAQIELGFVTPFDDLDLPAIEPERRADLAARMPKQEAEAEVPKPRRWWIPAIAGAAATALITAIIAIALVGGSGKLPDEVAQMSAEAVDAAARARYVYPPPNDPDAATAYAKVLELEREGGSAGEDEAERLRKEFAATLSYLGNMYWDREGGRPFAVDFYAQALLFDDSNPQARERGALTPGQLADLQRKADESDFTESELVAAAPLAVMAEEDVEVRRERLAELAETSGSRSLTADAKLETLLAGMGEEMPRKRTKKRDRKPASKKPEAVAQGPATTKPDEPDAPAEPVAAAIDPAAATPAAAPTSKEHRDPKRALQLANEGTTALRSSKLARAETLYHQALDHDRRCGRALIGLSDVHFERAQHQKAVSWAEKAVKVSPGNAGYRIKLGDAYFKVLRYSDARRQYDRAAALGSGVAGKRLAKLDAKVGK